MHIDWWTLGLQTVNLLVLLWLLGRFLFRPMAAIVAQRQQEAESLLDDAKARQAQADADASAARTEREAADADRAGVIAAAHKDAEAQRGKLLEAARQEVQAKLAEAQADIAHREGEAEARIGHRATALATDIAARLLEGPGAELPVTAFLKGFAKAVASLPDATRKMLGADSDKVLLTSAKPLGDADLAACREAVAGALGHEVALDTAVDPSLIAGLRLTGATIEVNANLRADLSRVLAGLDRHDR